MLFLEDVYELHTWDQNCDFCNPPVMDLVVKIDHAIFLSCSKIRDIAAFESGRSLAEVSDKCLARHSEDVCSVWPSSRWRRGEIIEDVVRGVV